MIPRRRRESSNSGFSGPPSADTAIVRPPSMLNTMLCPSGVHAALAAPSPVASKTDVTARPARATLPMPRFVVNPTNSLSGDQKRSRAPSVPSTRNGSCLSKGCSQRPPSEPVVLNATARPSGAMAALRIWRSPATASTGRTVKRRTCAGSMPDPTGSSNPATNAAATAHPIAARTAHARGPCRAAALSPAGEPGSRSARTDGRRPPAAGTGASAWAWASSGAWTGETGWTDVRPLADRRCSSSISLESSRASWYRSAGDLARHFSTIHSSSIGTRERCDVTGSGSSLRIE